MFELNTEVVSFYKHLTFLFLEGTLVDSPWTSYPRPPLSCPTSLLKRPALFLPWVVSLQCERVNMSLAGRLFQTFSSQRNSTANSSWESRPQKLFLGCYILSDGNEPLTLTSLLSTPHGINAKRQRPCSGLTEEEETKLPN